MNQYLGWISCKVHICFPEAQDFIRRQIICLFVYWFFYFLYSVNLWFVFFVFCLLSWPVLQSFGKLTWYLTYLLITNSLGVVIIHVRFLNVQCPVYHDMKKIYSTYIFSTVHFYKMYLINMNEVFLKLRSELSYPPSDVLNENTIKYCLRLMFA